MTESEGVSRRLAAILMADAVGYSRLMGADEPHTVRTLQAYRQTFIRQIEFRRGRVLDAKDDTGVVCWGDDGEGQINVPR